MKIFLTKSDLKIEVITCKTQKFSFAQTECADFKTNLQMDFEVSTKTQTKSMQNSLLNERKLGFLIIFLI